MEFSTRPALLRRHQPGPYLAGGCAGRTSGRSGTGAARPPFPRSETHGRHDPQGADGPAGHSSVRAALIYQHATRDRDRAIAEALGSLVREAQQEPGEAPGEQPERGERGGVRRPARMWHVCGTEPPWSAGAARRNQRDKCSDLGRDEPRESGRRESNPHHQLGSSVASHPS